MPTKPTHTPTRGKPPKAGKPRATKPSLKTPVRVAAFLAALGATGRVTQAAKAARVDRSTVYDWRRADPEFAKAWDEAEELGVGLLEDEAVRRAVEGVPGKVELVPVFRDGVEVARKPVVTVVHYSDTLLAMLLRAKRPALYRERVEHGGKVALSFKVDLGE